MNNLSGIDLSQNNLSPAIGIDKSVDDKMTPVPEAILTNPEANKIFEDWYSQQSDPETAESLFKKLTLLSLKPPTLLAALLFLQYQKEVDLPEQFENVISACVPRSDSTTNGCKLGF